MRVRSGCAHHICGYGVQAIRSANALSTHRMHLLISAEQKAWLDSQTSALKTKSEIIRDLIEKAMQPIPPTEVVVRRPRLSQHYEHS